MGIPVKCNDFLNELNDYLDGAITPDLRAELEEHLTWCKHCYIVCNTTRKTIEIYRDNQIFELPDPLRTKLQSAIMTRCKESKKASD
jgi:hypothetical protein